MVTMLLPAGSYISLSPMMVTGYSLAFLSAMQLISQLTLRMVADPTDCFWKVKQREMPAALNDSELGTHGYLQTEKILLHYVEKGDRSKPLMVLVHGYPEFWYSWRHQIKEFSSDYWVVAMDMRGFGDSEKPQGAEHYQADTIAADILDLVTGLGRKKVTVVGHDWGGVITWYFVQTYIEYVDNYIIMNSAHPYAMLRKLNTDLRQIKRSWYMMFSCLPVLPELQATIDDMAYLNSTIVSSKTPSTITPEDLECYKYMYGQPGAFTTALNIYRANMRLETSHLLVDKGRCPNSPPGLMIFGTGDKILDLLQEDSAKMAANTKLVYIPKATHFVQQDDPVAVNKEMRTFLSSIKPRNC